jgi:hypothetical protein
MDLLPKDRELFADLASYFVDRTTQETLYYDMSEYDIILADIKAVLITHGVVRADLDGIWRELRLRLALELPSGEQSTQREAPSTHEAPPLPDKAPKLYRDRPKGQNIIDFLRDPDGWGPYVASGVLSRPDLRRLDPQAYKAVENWLLSNPLPTDVQLAKKVEITDRIVAQHSNALELPTRTLAALQSRRRRHARMAKPK